MIRQAIITDAKAIQNLVNTYAKKGEMLLLSLNDIYEKVFEFIVYEEDGVIYGACALHPTWSDAAEVRSLAVHPDKLRKGLGTLLVKKQLERAKEYGFTKVFALTYKQDFFESLGFKVVPIDSLPKKIWTDCLKCTKYPDCDEIAVELILE